MKTKNHTNKKAIKYHEGEWVAISGNKVLACDRNPGKLMDIVKEKYSDIETVIMRVHGKNQILLL